MCESGGGVEKILVCSLPYEAASFRRSAGMGGMEPGDGVERWCCWNQESSLWLKNCCDKGHHRHRLVGCGGGEGVGQARVNGSLKCCQRVEDRGLRVSMRQRSSFYHTDGKNGVHRADERFERGDPSDEIPNERKQR